MGSRASRIARLALKTGLVALGLLLVAELALQLLAHLVPERAGHWRVGARYRVLALGDSHTWGSGVERADAYPGQLQRTLDARAPGVYSVINRGLPGMSTTQLRNRFGVMLARYEPDAVVIWCGSNNLWNHAERDRATTPARLRVDGWLGRLRLYRLVRVALHDRALERMAETEAGGGDVWTVEGHDRVGADEQRFDVRHDGVVERITHQHGADDPLLFERTLADLEAVAATARAAGVALLLVTYPVEKAFFAEVNRAIREAARRSDLVVVESAAALERIPEEERGWKWALHPDERLYGEVAADLAAHVVAARTGPLGEATLECPDLLAPLTEGFGATGRRLVRTERVESSRWPGHPVWVHTPDDVEAPPVVIFAPANGHPDPESYAWLVHHVVSRGLALIYAQHQVGERHEERYAALWEGVSAAVEARGADLDLTRIGLVGHSYGAGALPYLAHRALVEEGWGSEGAFLLSMAPWYALGLEGRDLSELPGHLKALFLVFEEDEVTDHRLAIAQRALLGDRTESDYLMLRRNARGGCQLPAGHAVPQSAGLGGRNDAYDARVVLRLLDALAAYAFEGDEEGRRVALGRGDPAQVSLGTWIDGAPLRPLLWTEHPEPARPEAAYLFQQRAEAEWRRRGEEGS